MASFKTYRCTICNCVTTKTCQACDFVPYCSPRCAIQDAKRHHPHECGMTREQRRVYKRVNLTLLRYRAPLCYRHTGSAVKKFGLFATVLLSKGDVVMEDISFVSGTVLEFERVPTILRDKETFESFWSLDHDATLPTVKEREMSVVNKCGIFASDSTVHLTYVLSRINHSCQPNAEIVTDSVDGVHLVVALRTIFCGEEILIQQQEHTVDDPFVRGIMYFSRNGVKCVCQRCVRDKCLY